MEAQMAGVVCIAATCVALAADSKAEASRHYQLGSRAFVEKRFEEAISELTKSLALDGNQLGAIRLLGLSYQLSGRLEEAEAQFQDACRLAPKSADSWYYLGRVQFARNFFDKARGSLETALQYNSGDSRIRECLAMTLEALGEDALAEREYAASIRLVGDKAGLAATPYLNYGAFLLKRNRVPESEQLLQRAIAAMPGSWQAHFELAKLFHLTDRFDASLKQLEMALTCERTEEETQRTHGLLATVYARLGREDESRKAALAAQQ